MPFDIGQALQQYPQVAPPQQGPIVQPVVLQDTATPPAQPAPSIGAAIPPAKDAGWKSRIGALFQDPDFNKSLIAFGANLMQSPQKGQNLGDVFGQSLLAGVNTYQGLKDKADTKAKQQAQVIKEDQRYQDTQKLDQQKLQLGKDELADRANDRASREKIAADENAVKERITKNTGIPKEQIGDNWRAVQALSKDLQQSQKMDEVTADAGAVRQIFGTAKAPAPENLLQNYYEKNLQQLSSAYSLEQLKNPGIITELMQRAQVLARAQVQGGQNLDNRTGATNTPNAPQVPGAGGAEPGAYVIKPQLQFKSVQELDAAIAKDPSIVGQKVVVGGQVGTAHATTGSAPPTASMKPEGIPDAVWALALRDNNNNAQLAAASLSRYNSMPK